MTDDERKELEQLREERWQVVAMRNGALNRAEAAEAKLAALRKVVLDQRPPMVAAWVLGQRDGEDNLTSVPVIRFSDVAAILLDGEEA